jgi:hypothetical protein
MAAICWLEYCRKTYRRPDWLSPQLGADTIWLDRLKPHRVNLVVCRGQSRCGRLEKAHCGRFAPDLDPDEARASRRSLLADAATTNALVLGAHFAGTSAGRILSAEDGYRFVPETPA